MYNLIYLFTSWVAHVHYTILSWNDNQEIPLTDKQLHFIVIGIVGMLMLFVVHPLFTWLAKKHHVLIISWIYVFTCILVLTFAIEIGQGYTGTGVMDASDMMSGILGFLLMFAVFAAVRGVILFIIKAIKKRKKRLAAAARRTLIYPKDY